MVNDLGKTKNHQSASIATIRADLAAWSAGKPRMVLDAVRFLDGWLAVAADPPVNLSPDVDVLACTARAVETLRSAMGRN